VWRKVTKDLQCVFVGGDDNASDCGAFLILWLLKFGFHIAGNLIYLLLLVALVALVIDLVGGRRRTA
jgi:hypothetical protein